MCQGDYGYTDCSQVINLVVKSLFLIHVNMEERKLDNSLVGQVLPEDQALLFHQHLPENTHRESEKILEGERDTLSER